MADYNSLKLNEKLIQSQSSFNKLYQIIGKDNQYYSMKILYQEKFNSIIFKAKIVGDFTEVIYTKSLKLEDFYNLNRFF